MPSNRNDQTRKKSTSVLRTPDLKTLIHVLCRLTKIESFTFDQFQKEYERVSEREISSKTAEDYFYAATKWRLILREKNRYYASKPEMEILCEYENEGKELELKNYFFNLLKSREPAFSHFLDFVKSKPTLSDLNRQFNPHTAGTLLRWAAWLGIISKSTIEHRYYLTIKEKHLTLERFWEVVKTAYERLRETELPGVKSAYVKIPDLRDLCCLLEELTSKEFDIQLSLLLRTEKYGDRIELSGAPIAFIQQEIKKDKKKKQSKKTFEFNKKTYYFIAITKSKEEGQ